MSKQRLLAISIALAAVLATSVYLLTTVPGHNNRSDEKQIEHAVKKYTAIEYGVGNKKELDQIASKEFTQSHSLDMEHGWEFYQLDTNFMRSAKKLGPNRVKVGTAVSWVEGAASSDFFLEKTPEGRYVIVNIESDL